jgi:seryl-tRNA synthetase
MHDIKLIRDNPSAFDAGLARRNHPPITEQLLALDTERREAVTAAQTIQAERNKLSKEIGQRKAKGEDASDILAAVARSKDEQAAAEAKAAAKGQELDALLATIPNLPAADVPDGKDETANVEIRRWSEPAKFAFTPKDHVAIGEGLGMMDFERAAKLSRALRGVIWHAGAARAGTRRLHARPADWRAWLSRSQPADSGA